MRHYIFLLIIAVFLSPFIVFGGTSLPAGEVQLSVGGILLDIEQDPGDVEIAFNGDSFTITTSGELKISSSDRRRFEVSPISGQKGFTCTSVKSTLTVSGTSITITPLSNTCSIDGGGGGGGGGGGVGGSFGEGGSPTTTTQLTSTAQLTPARPLSPATSKLATIRQQLQDILNKLRRVKPDRVTASTPMLEYFFPASEVDLKSNKTIEMGEKATTWLSWLLRVLITYIKALWQSFR